MKISQIFYSIQGEGAQSGQAAVFVRFYGCNLACDFCDEPLHKTHFEEMSTNQVLAQVLAHPAQLVILTGGEPSLEDRNPLIQALQRQGKRVAVETNGAFPENIQEADWITYSPKDLSKIGEARFAQEVKVIIGPDFDPAHLRALAQLPCPVYLQPQAQGDQPDQATTALAVELVKTHPRFRLSLQSHKLIQIP